MQIFIEAIDLNIWEAIEIGPYVPTIVDASTSTTTEKPRDKWTEEDRWRIQYDLKAKNIITSALAITTPNICIHNQYDKPNSQGI